MTLLIDSQILEHMEKGTIVIDPYVPDRLNTDSYDLTLGPYFYFYDRGSSFEKHPDKDAIGDGYTLYDARAAGGIWMAPGDRVLGHTVEVVGGRVAMIPAYVDKSQFGRQIEVKEHYEAVTTHLQATSTAARHGITACMCAGWGDVGFVNIWTLEIENRTPNRLFLPVGSIISQMCFTKVEIPNEIYGRDKGQYMSVDPGEEAEIIRKAWKTESMLPGPLKVRDSWREFWPPDTENENVICQNCVTKFVTSSDEIGKCPRCGGPGRIVS